MTARWDGPDGDCRSDPSTLPVDLYRATQEPTIEQRGLRRVLDIEAGRHRTRLTYRAQVALAIAVLVLVVVPAFCGYALLIETVAHHWQGTVKACYVSAAAAVLFYVTRRSQR